MAPRRSRVRAAFFLLIGLLAATAPFNGAVAQETSFYRVVTSRDWLVLGSVETLDAGVLPLCGMTQSYNNGSYFLFAEDLQTHVFFLLVRNVAWNVGARTGTTFDLQMNFNNSQGGLFASFPATATLLERDTILIGDINLETFVPPFYHAYVLDLVMPGTVPSASVSLLGTIEAMQYMIACENAYANGGRAGGNAGNGIQNPATLAPRPIR